MRGNVESAGRATHDRRVGIRSIEAIQSFDAPHLQPYATMRWRQRHRRQGVFVTEGEKCVRRLLRSDHQVVSVLLPEKWFHELRPTIDARSEDIRVFTAEKRLLERLAGYTMYQGLLAIARVPPVVGIPEILSETRSPRLFVALDGLANAENVGAMVRNCVAFHTQAVIVGETSSSPYIRRAVRSSMATVFDLRVVETGSLRRSLVQLRVGGVTCIAAHPHHENSSPAETDLSGDCCVVMGSEGYGISDEILRVCDRRVAIPMASTVNSLNVSSAAAVFLYEINRQRRRC